MFRKTLPRKFLWGQDFSKFVNSTITKNGSRNGNFINGEFLSSSNSHIMISNPSSDENIATFSSATESMVNDALDAAANSFSSSSIISNRSALLHNLANFLEEDLETIAKAESLNSGLTLKSITLSLQNSVSWIRFCANWSALSSSGQNQQQGSYFSSSSFTVTSCFEPLGTVAVISSSYSTGGGLASAIVDIVSALAAGNSVVWKPSELTPLSSLLFASLISEAQFPPGVFNLVQGSNDVGSVLAKSSKVQCVAFSGKSSTASKIQIDAAQSNFKSVLSECEDVSSIFVGKSAGDLDRALYCAMLAFRNSGQGIVPSAFPLIAPATPKRLVIHQDVCDEFLQRLVGERVQQSRWKLGHALDPSIDQGPMLNAQLQQKILDEIVFATTHKSKSRGMIADLVFGGFAPKFPGGGKFVAPTCLINVDPSIPLWTSPITSLGPILCVSTFPNNDEEQRSTMSMMKNKFGGSCYVFSNDKKEIEGLKRLLNIGTILINPTTTKDSNFMPCSLSFEKRKISGNKIVGGGASILEQYCRRRNVVEYY